VVIFFIFFYFFIFLFFNFVTFSFFSFFSFFFIFFHFFSFFFIFLSRSYFVADAHSFALVRTMPSWKLKKAQRHQRKLDRRTQLARIQFRTRQHYASMFVTLFNYFICFLRPVEVNAIMSLCRDSYNRDWDHLLKLYMRFYYHQDSARLFGADWFSSWDAPIREKLSKVLNRSCICGAVTDHFDHVSKIRLCFECSRDAMCFTCSLTTPLFYDEEVYADLNQWTQDPVGLLETIPTGKRVHIEGSIFAEYDNIQIDNAIWISGVNHKKSSLHTGHFTTVIRASVRLTDCSITNGDSNDYWLRPEPPNAHPAIQIMPMGYCQSTVLISGCFISGLAGEGILVLGGHCILRKNYFKWCSHSAISCKGGTVDAVGNKFRKLMSSCLQDHVGPDDVHEVIAKFRAANDIRCRPPHFYFPRRSKVKPIKTRP
jgi:hypothetical protein